MTRPPASASENCTHDAEKIELSRYSDFFNRIGQTRTKCIAAKSREAAAWSARTVLVTGRFRRDDVWRRAYIRSQNAIAFWSSIKRVAEMGRCTTAISERGRLRLAR
jgi:hypothetical protein